MAPNQPLGEAQPQGGTGDIRRFRRFLDDVGCSSTPVNLASVQFLQVVSISQPLPRSQVTLPMQCLDLPVTKDCVGAALCFAPRVRQWKGRRGGQRSTCTKAKVGVVDELVTGRVHATLNRKLRML